MSDNENDAKAARTPLEGHDGLFTFRNIERNADFDKELVNGIVRQVEDSTKSRDKEKP
jgi:hypothetical protein